MKSNNHKKNNINNNNNKFNHHKNKNEDNKEIIYKMMIKVQDNLDNHKKIYYKMNEFDSIEIKY